MKQITQIAPLQLINEEANKVWKQFASTSDQIDPQIELEIHKKLLNFFQIGDYYYFIFNFRTREFDYVSESIWDMLGYEPSEFTVSTFMSTLHEDDRPWVISFEKTTGDFFMQIPSDKIMKYKNRYEYRVVKKNGGFLRVMHQVMIAQMDEDGGFIRSIGVVTDISHIKMDGRPTMSMVGMDGEASYHNLAVENIFLKTKDVLSNREKQILLLLTQGKLSKEIADLLFVSKQTVDSHRKNMLRKANVSTTGELISKAIRDGWI